MSEKKDPSDEMIAFCNKNLYEQSSKASTICRTMCYALIATLWAMSYKNKSFYLPEGWLCASLFTCGFFLLVDLAHYVVDTILMYHHAHFANNNRSKDIEKQMHPRFKVYSQTSFCFLISKVAICIFAVAFFITGCFYNLPS